MATTTTPQLNTTTTIDIHESTSLCESILQNNASVHDTDASTIRIDLGEEDSVSSVTALLPSDEKAALSVQKQLRQQPTL